MREGWSLLEVAHNGWLVAASLAVALMAGFTGLSLTKGASALPVGPRKTRVAMGAIALGGGIWAMHFVAMLGLQLPILFYYNPLITLISALVAILIVGVAFLILHFLPRTRLGLTAAGVCVGVGIPVMHYIGMSGMELCRPLYSFGGVAMAGLASVALGVGAVWVAYGGRSNRNIVMGTLCFGIAVFSVHFLAMAGTDFTAVEDAVAPGPRVGNETLAFIVAVIAFVICGSFLLSGVTLLPVEAPEVQEDAQHIENRAETKPRAVLQIPYELDGRTLFVPSSDVTAIRAEGHYTILYALGKKLFCPWAISEAEARLPKGQFLRTHRSYLVNPAHVTGFERKKDNGVIFFDRAGQTEKAPVSRSRLADVRAALGLV